MKRHFFLQVLLFALFCNNLSANDIVVKINFCAKSVATTNAEWNNYCNYNNTNEAPMALKDVGGNQTEMAISLSGTFNGVNTLGVQATTTSLKMTDTESYSAFWSQASGSNAKASSSFTLSGLDPEAEYDFVIFGSRDGQKDNRETLYSFAGSNTGSATLNCSGNASEVASVNGIKSTAGGRITLTLQPGSNNDNAQKYYYINTMQVTQRGGGKDMPVVRVLAIGNSFSTDAVEHYLYDLAKEARVDLIIGNAYMGGASLKTHWNAIVQNNNKLEYRKIVKGSRSNTTDQALSDIITDEPWDFITFQQVSQYSGLPDTFEPYLGNLIDYATSHVTNSSVQLGYHMTWAYAQNSTHSGFANYNNDQMTMYHAIIDATKKALNDHPELTFVVPSGTAIQNARTSEIGDNMNRDGYHLDIGVGRYTAACTWLEAILGINPSGMEYHPASVDESTAFICQKAAHSAVTLPYETTNMSNHNDDNYIAFEEDATLLPVYTDGQKSNVKMWRTIKGGQWNTLVLPFTLTKTEAETIFGSDMELAEFTSWEAEYADGDDTTPYAITIGLTTYTMTDNEGIAGGRPYVIKTSKDIDYFEVDNVTLVSTVDEVERSDKYGTSGKFTGTFVKTEVPADGLFVSDNLFWYSTGKTDIKAFRCWFELGAVLDKETDFGAKVFFVFEDETGVNEGLRMANEDTTPAYNLQGQRVDNPHRGIYIIGNKKVLR